LTSKTLAYIAAALTIIAGILHLALVPMYRTVMTLEVTIFFIVSGLAQLFWVIPIVKLWIKPWYYIGIGGTAILIIMWAVAVPGRGYPVDVLQIVIELCQIIFIIVSCIIVSNARINVKLNDL